MRHTKLVQKELEELIDITCDICFKSCATQNMENYRCYEYATLMTDWGYGVPRDGESKTLHICFSCYENIEARFDIGPQAGRQDPQ